MPFLSNLARIVLLGSIIGQIWGLGFGQQFLGLLTPPLGRPSKPDLSDPGGVHKGGGVAPGTGYPWGCSGRLAFDRWTNVDVGMYVGQRLPVT